MGVPFGTMRFRRQWYYLCEPDAAAARALRERLVAEVQRLRTRRRHADAAVYLLVTGAGVSHFYLSPGAAPVARAHEAVPCDIEGNVTIGAPLLEPAAARAPLLTSLRRTRIASARG